jgi:chromosome partitioning protein
MGNLIAVGNLKGGTGKSTIAVNLACALAADGATVVLVDADAQGTVTDWHAGERLPVPVEALPLGGERDAQRTWL